MSDFLFGVEIECFKRDGKEIGYPYEFFRGYDSSICFQDKKTNRDGIELRNPKPFLLTDENLKKCVDLLKLLKSSNYEVNESCGLHIHISSPSSKKIISELIVDWGKVEITKLNAYQIKKKRFSYCQGERGKYCAIRKISSNHVEFRNWNGSLNVRHFYRCMNESFSLYKKMLMMSS